MISHSLHISGKTLNSCKDVAYYLKQERIIGNVSENYTITKKDKEYIDEVGCKIVFTSDPNELWTKLKKKYNLDCAYFKTHMYYEGCIYDYSN